jgi:hypothetical protein
MNLPSHPWSLAALPWKHRRVSCHPPILYPVGIEREDDGRRGGCHGQIRFGTSQSLAYPSGEYGREQVPGCSYGWHGQIRFGTSQSPAYPWGEYAVSQVPGCSCGCHGQIRFGTGQSLAYTWGEYAVSRVPGCSCGCHGQIRFGTSQSLVCTAGEYSVTPSFRPERSGVEKSPCSPARAAKAVSSTALGMTDRPLRTGRPCLLGRPPPQWFPLCRDSLKSMEGSWTQGEPVRMCILWATPYRHFRGRKSTKNH